MDLGRRKGSGTRVAGITRNRETEAAVAAAKEEGTCWPLTFLAGVGWAWKGQADLIKLEVARNLGLICDAGGRSLTKGKTNQRSLSWGW